MKRSVVFLIVLVGILTLLGCKDTYTKTIEKKLKIEHVYSLPTLAYGPGAVVMYEHKSGYSGICKPEDVIGQEKPTTHPIANVGIGQNTQIEFDVKLGAEDYGEIGTNYHNISKAVFSLTNGKQDEIITDYSKVFERLKAGTCGSNMKTLQKEHKKAKFYFIRVAYAYDLDFSLYSKSGGQITGPIPSNVLDVISVKIGMKIASEENQTLSGKALYLGFNGTPYTVKETLQAEEKAWNYTEEKGTGMGVPVAATGEYAEEINVIDVTELLK